MATPRFEFGKNWRDYVEKHFSPEKVETSKEHILAFLRRPDLAGLRFLDIGCGSGLHSLAAYEAGAREVVSFDYDANSVEATRLLHRHAGAPANWRVLQGSVLDRDFLATLGEFDVVYSWGVLHHTGDQWTAIRNAASAVKRGGELYVALYTSDAFVDPTPEFWLDVKRRYVSSGWPTRLRLVLWYIWRFEFGGRPTPRKLARWRNQVRRYKNQRGMSYFHDVKDWLGGYPMEFSSIADVKRFADETLGFELKNIATGHANTEYLFARPKGGNGR